MSSDTPAPTESMTPEANARAFYETTARILFRAFLLGAGLQLLWLGVYMLFDSQWVAEVHSRFMGEGVTITAQQIGELTYYGVAVVKTFVFLVFLIPWLAIRWALKKRAD